MLENAAFLCREVQIWPNMLEIKALRCREALKMP